MKSRSSDSAPRTMGERRGTSIETNFGGGGG